MSLVLIAFFKIASLFFIGIACSSSNRSTLKDFIGSTLFFHDFSFTETCDLLCDFNSLLPYTGTLPQNFCKIFVQLNPCFQKQNVFVVNLIRTFAKQVSFLTTAFPGIGALNYHVFFGNSTFSTRPFKYYWITVLKFCRKFSACSSNSFFSTTKASNAKHCRCQVAMACNTVFLISNNFFIF